MIQSLATVIIPFTAKRANNVNRALDKLGDPQGDPYKTATAKLVPATDDPFLHFMSMVVIPARGSEPEAHLVIELCADGHPRDALAKLAEAIPSELCAILKETGENLPPNMPLAVFLAEHHHAFGPGWFRKTGLMFRGTPDMSVKRIMQEAYLATRIHELLEKQREGSAQSKLQHVRRTIFSEVDNKWAFVSEPMSKVLGPARPIGIPTIVWAFCRDLLWPLAPLPVVVFFVSWWALDHAFYDALWHFVAVWLIELALVLAAAWTGYRELRRQEEEDVPVDDELSKEKLDELLEREDRPGVVQNHLAGVSTMKPGWIRRITLRLALWLIGERGANASQPGFLDKIGSIHFARWFRLPGTDRLVFLSNYDGSWQSYLEDFIARLRQGLSSVWSNTLDFPKTTNLTEGGAGDGTRFKRWARRQQLPTRFWYSAYPALTTFRIRKNAAIRHGFASATDEREAAEWLSLFGYATRESLETPEIPTLVFGGLSKLSFAQCLVVTLPKKDKAREWLKSIEDDITYGDRSPKAPALVVAFTARGLAKLDLDEQSLATFPIAFQQGMAHDVRARSLGDDPSTWAWEPEKVDALLLLYDASQADLDIQTARRRKQLEGFGGSISREIPTAELQEVVHEAFGFRDGISQPIMRGTVAGSRETDPTNTIQPGELVLGYLDNLGNIPPVPQACGQDIGRNGSFLVVRQIEQDPDAFSKYLTQVADALAKAKDPRAPTHDPDALKEWIAAKMLGRWMDGTSLVRHPHMPGSSRKPPAEPDNMFLFGREDPDGLRCPFGAHIRRANPRDSFDPGSQTQIDISNRHRILRVGRPYDGQGPGGKPGLLFMCINADIERQFEFLQQSWIRGADFHGLDNESDPIVGGGGKTMVVPTTSGPLRLPALAQFVKVLGGEYFFMPSRSALSMLTGRMSSLEYGTYRVPDEVTLQAAGH